MERGDASKAPTAACYLACMFEPSLTAGLRDMFVFFLWLSFAGLVAAAILGTLLWRRLRRATDLVVTGGGFWQTLREVPFALVVFIDLLDLGLETFSAP